MLSLLLLGRFPEQGVQVTLLHRMFWSIVLKRTISDAFLLASRGLRVQTGAETNLKEGST